MKSSRRRRLDCLCFSFFYNPFLCRIICLKQCCHLLVKLSNYKPWCLFTQGTLLFTAPFRFSLEKIRRCQNGLDFKKQPATETRVMKNYLYNLHRFKKTSDIFNSVFRTTDMKWFALRFDHEPMDCIFLFVPIPSLYAHNISQTRGTEVLCIT